MRVDRLSAVDYRISCTVEGLYTNFRGTGGTYASDRPIGGRFRPPEMPTLRFL